jgi:hypothetical protein
MFAWSIERNRMKYFCLVLVIGAVHAENREIGVLGGGAFLPGVPVQGAAVSVSAGLQPGPAAGAFFGQDLYSRVSGEIRYLFELRNLRLTSGGASATFSGRAHVLQYELQYHLRPRSERVRPFLAVGGGMKLFQGTGEENAYQPLMQYAYLTHTRELKPLLTVGAGFKMHLARRMILHVDLRDQITGFPSKTITPAPGMAIKGWLHDFVPTVGLSWAL